MRVEFVSSHLLKFPIFIEDFLRNPILILGQHPACHFRKCILVIFTKFELSHCELVFYIEFEPCFKNLHWKLSLT